MANSCFYSSFLFLTNSLFALLKQQYTYSIAFYTLAVTSIVVHGIYHSLETVILDKLAILSVVILGANHLISKRNDISIYYGLCIIFSFISVIVLYYYGYLTAQFYYDENKIMADLCNSIIHFVSSIGHHMIIYLL